MGLADTPQPEPDKGNVEIFPLVIADIKAREELGIKTYGTTLEAHNGRDALVDAYQEILDAAIYLRQVIAERDGK